MQDEQGKEKKGTYKQRKERKKNVDGGGRLKKGNKTEEKYK